MKPETYDYLCENALNRAIEDVLQSIPELIQKKYSVSYLNNFDKKKKAIFEEYDIQRKNVRKKFFDAGEDGEKLIDIHKVSACFTAAVLKVRVFDYKELTPMDMSVFCSNYTLAFLSGIHILYLCMLADYEKSGKKELVKLLKKQATFIFPETNKGHDQYLQGRVKTLALNDIYAMDFDILTYADMLYWIEKYNKDELQKLNEKENLENGN